MGHARSLFALASLPLGIVMAHAGCSSFGDEPEGGSVPVAPSSDAGSDAAANDGSPVVEGGPAVDAETDSPAVDPAACDPAKCRLVFVTSATTTGDIGGVEGADELCEAATSAGAPRVQGKKFKAWISTSSVQATNRFMQRKLEYRRLDGAVVAKNMNDIVSKGLDQVISQTETGGYAAAELVWTGTLATGTRTADTCGTWDDDSMAQVGRVGRTDATDSLWTNAPSVSCSTPAHLYCFEEP